MFVRTIPQRVDGELIVALTGFTSPGDHGIGTGHYIAAIRQSVMDGIQRVKDSQRTPRKAGGLPCCAPSKGAIKAPTR